MEDEAKVLCRCCNSQHTQLDYALHRVSNNHVKNVQRKMVHRGFASTCLVCNCALKDLKQAEAHVQEKTHSDRMKSFLVDSYLCSDKYTCGSCGITFYNEVALEAHCLLSSSHDLRGSPKLDELSRLLSGLRATQSGFTCNHSCRICDATFPGIEDSIMHIFTASHVLRLRSSSCMVCKKDFTHASDRELHINSHKHHTAVWKCRDLLEEGQAHARLTKEGYPCMLCMIWCNSWFCLELHLLDKHHARTSAQSKATCPVLARISFSAALEGSGQSASCDETIMNSWRQWISDASDECVWCHRCGVLVSSIDEADKHLNMHSIGRCSTLSRSHSDKLLDLASVSEIFSCSTCAVSFRNALMLSVHEASFEHHSRLAVCCLTHDVQCCPNCGLVMNSGGHGNGALGGSLSQTKRPEVSSRSMGLCEQKSSSYVRAKNLSNVRVLDTDMQVRSLAEGTHQTPIVAEMGATSFLLSDKGTDNSLKASMAPGPRELLVSSNGKTARGGEGVDRLSIKNGFVRNESFCTKCIWQDDNVRSQAGDARHVLNSENGHMSRNGIVTGKSSAGTNVNGTDHSPFEVLLPKEVANSPLVDGHLQHTHASLDMSVVPQNPLLLTGPISDSNGSELTKKASFGDTSVPIVVAATFAPLGTLQESLQSITAIITETLSSALPSFYMQQSSPGLKRKSQGGAEDETCSQQRDVKQICSQRILEAALRQGLQSVCPNAITSNDMGVQCQGSTDEENLKFRRGNGGDLEVPQAVLAVAASVIPNGPQGPSRPSGMQVQVEGNKAQGSSALQSGDDSNKRAQESVEVKSESLSQVAVGDQGSAGSTRGKTVVDEKPNQLQSSHGQPLLCIGAQNVGTANGAISYIKNEVPLPPAKKLAAATMRVVESVVSDERKSNDDSDDADDDCYAFLDPTKSQFKWWSSSDSEDSDSVRK